MKADQRFLELPLEFWANVRLISQKVGYTKRGLNEIKIPQPLDIVKSYRDINLNYHHIVSPDGQLTEYGNLIVSYFQFRAEFLNNYVRPNLMNVDEARKTFTEIRSSFNPTCILPMNKQTGEKKTYAFFTSIINMLIEKHSGTCPVDYDPRELTSFTRNQRPVRTLSRRVDGAFPNIVNPVAIWEIKEYYYTTTFGSRIADGVYESQLDGMELLEIKRNLNIPVNHYLMVDAYDTWWDQGKSYLCRICDMLHMGILTEALFGKEVLLRIPQLVKEWLTILNAPQKK